MEDEDKSELTPAEENPWYQLATLGGDDHEECVRLWNGYIRYLLERDGKDANNLKLFDGAIIELPKLTSTNLSKINQIKSLPETLWDDINLDFLIFEHSIFFDGFYFGGSAVFTNSWFLHRSNFDNCYFGEGAYFSSCRFDGYCGFSRVNFSGETTFGICEFSRFAAFQESHFLEGVDFYGCTFGAGGNFMNCKFSKTTDFSDASDGHKCKGPISFYHATFQDAPLFFERKLHEDTDWTGANWPGPPNHLWEAENYIRRYDCLARMMSDFKKYDDEHMFFRLSTQAKEVRDGLSIGCIASRLYGTLFNYGWGFERALGLWLANIVLGAGYLSFFQSLSWTNVVNSLAVSFSNALPFLGLHRGALEKTYKAFGHVPGFNTLWFFQAIIGTIFLFFLLLTIRNRFRLK
jgi:hypothetical protein